MIQMRIMRCGENELLAIETFKVMDEIIDHVIAMDDGFAAAEDELFPGQERKMFIQPLEFFRQALWKLHCGRHDKQVIFLVQFGDYFLAIFIYRHRAKKIWTVRKLRNNAVVVWEAFSLPFAIEYRPLYTHAEFLFVIVNELAGCVGHYIIHIDDQSFHISDLIIFPNGKGIVYVHSLKDAVASLVLLPVIVPLW